MIDQLPEGKSIGWMQAPPQWIFTHTVRFIGIVRVVIQDGEGFILIQKGKPLAYYFKHGRIELRGHAALDYFNSHPTIEFNLCKYNPEEFAEALKICNIDEQGVTIPPQPERKTPTVTEAPPAQQPQPSVPVIENPPAPVIERKAPEEPATPAPVPTPSPLFESPPPRPSAIVPEPEREKPAVRSIPPPPPVMPPQPVFDTPAVPASPVIPSAPVQLDEDAIRIIGQIKKLNGVVAISVFDEERNIILMGDVEIEPLLKIARNMLSTTRKITPLLEWGSFVHMTLQIPEGNVIVAPYHDYHLCLLTTRTINIGHIRRILRDLQISSDGE